jgi:hypothetical protein
MGKGIAGRSALNRYDEMIARWDKSKAERDERVRKRRAARLARERAVRLANQRKNRTA